MLEFRSSTLKIIKPYIITTKGVSLVIITPQYYTQQDCMKASCLICSCFNNLLLFKRHPNGEMSLILSCKIDTLICHLFKYSKSGLT